MYCDIPIFYKYRVGGNFFLLLLACLQNLWGSDSSAPSIFILKKDKLSEAEISLVQKSIDEVIQNLPDSIRKINLLSNPISIELADLDAHFGEALPLPECLDSITLFTGRKRPKIGNIYGKLSRQNGVSVITLNRRFLLNLTEPSVQTYQCGHLDMRNAFKATILHEFAHYLDQNMASPSQQSNFLRTLNFKEGWFWGAEPKNHKPARSPDTYEFESPEEAFAVNFEYFILDPEFACRRQTVNEYFNNLFGITGISENCSSFTTLFLSDLNNSRLTIDPARVYRVDYLLASAGEGVGSGFGHAMLRLIICAPEKKIPYIDAKNPNGISYRIKPETPFGEDCVQDIESHLVISFRADMTTNSAIFQNPGFSWALVKKIVGALFGWVPSIMYIYSYPAIVYEYAELERRNLESYPLKLTITEKNRLIARIIEYFWSYRGNYKFVSNNCAVETLELLQSIEDLENYGQASIANRSAIKPYGVLKILQESTMAKDSWPSIVPAVDDHLVATYSKAYSLSKMPASDAIRKFILNSKLDYRTKVFEKILNDSKVVLNGKNLGDLAPSSIFLVRSKMLNFIVFESVLEKSQAHAGLLKMQAEIGEIIEKIENGSKKTTQNVKQQISLFKLLDVHLWTIKGYGIPRESEIPTEEDRQKIVSIVAEQTKNFYNEFAEIPKLQKEYLERISTLEKFWQTINEAYSNFEIERVKWLERTAKTWSEELKAKSQKTWSARELRMELNKRAGGDFFLEADLDDGSLSNP